jgi:hypothetical protein
MYSTLCTSPEGNSFSNSEFGFGQFGEPLALVQA